MNPQRGVSQLLTATVAIISDLDDPRLPALARELLVLQVEHLHQIEARITALDGRLVRQAREDEACRRQAGSGGRMARRPTTAPSAPSGST